MRILFLIYHGFSEHSGISKKIHYQVKGLRENGHDVRLCYYDFAANGHRCRYIDGKVLKDYGSKYMVGLRQRIDYDCIYDYCVRERIEFVYALHLPPSTLHLPPSTLHLIGVAEVRPWHAYDWVVAGLGQYKGDIDVRFHIVGGVHPNHMARYFAPLIEKYQLQDKVIFHGTLFGKELDDVFNQCQFAIGSLGRHRSGITVIKTLKNREYATRGIPFIYSEQDSDFDHQPYVVKAPADETPIDIEQIVHFMEHFTMSPEEIRATVGQLKWSIQMQHVVDGVFNS